MVYFKGGFTAITDALVAAIEKNGGQVLLSTPVQGVEVQGGKVPVVALAPAEGMLELSAGPFEGHREDDYIDFYYERNVPEQLSREGPQAGRADVNGDGYKELLSVFVKASKGEKLFSVACFPGIREGISLKPIWLKQNVKDVIYWVEIKFSEHEIWFGDCDQCDVFDSYRWNTKKKIYENYEPFDTH